MMGDANVFILNINILQVHFLEMTFLHHKYNANDKYTSSEPEVSMQLHPKVRLTAW